MDNLTETEKNIRLCWAINNAVQMNGAADGKKFDWWVDFFLEYFNKKRAEVWPPKPPQSAYNAPSATKLATPEAKALPRYNVLPNGVKVPMP